MVAWLFSGAMQIKVKCFQGGVTIDSGWIANFWADLVAEWEEGNLELKCKPNKALLNRSQVCKIIQNAYSYSKNPLNMRNYRKAHYLWNQYLVTVTNIATYSLIYIANFSEKYDR